MPDDKFFDFTQEKPKNVKIQKKTFFVGLYKFVN